MMVDGLCVQINYLILFCVFEFHKDPAMTDIRFMFEQSNIIRKSTRFERLDVVYEFCKLMEV